MTHRMERFNYIHILSILLLCSSNIAQKTPKKCPPQDAILPCRCLARQDEIQVWCSHSDLPNILEGLHALSRGTASPSSTSSNPEQIQTSPGGLVIDELILENNQLPSMPGRAFHTLPVLRLMVRYNNLERLSNDWLTGLEAHLMELYVVEPQLRSLPDESLHQLQRLEAVTIQTNLMKRLPNFSGLTRLRYLHLQSTNLVELNPRNFKNLPRLEKVHIVGSERLERLEAGVFEDLPRLQLINVTACAVNWVHMRAFSQLPMVTELSLVGNMISDAGIVAHATRDLPRLETLRLDRNGLAVLPEMSFVDFPALKTLTLAENRIVELHRGALLRLPRLRMLDLSRNAVRRIDRGWYVPANGISDGLHEVWIAENEIAHVSELRAILDALPDLKYLDMSRNRIQEIPFGVLRGHPSLERLHLDFNDIHVIEREAFMAMPALRELRLRNNSLSEKLLQNLPLWNLPSLKGLDLAANNFQRIVPGLLANLPSLKRIDLSGNRIVFIDPTAFLTSPELESVNISQNALPTVHPATFRHLRNLYELDVSENRLVEFVPGLPRAIERLHMARNVIPQIPQSPSPDMDLPSLRSLDLSANIIQRIPANTFITLPQLRHLYMSDNALNKLDSGSLHGLARLELLDITENRISILEPMALRDIPQVQDLRLRSNRLDLLTSGVFNSVAHMRKLDLSRNQLTEIVASVFENNHDIHLLDLSHNSLVTLPESLYQLSELRSLDLSDNRLKAVHPVGLENLALLERLRISGNYLQQLPSGSFSKLAKLKLLKLNNNEIVHIESRAITALPALKTLDLSNNRIEEIPNSAFYDLPTLQEIRLQDNKLKLIGLNAFHKVPHVLMLNLSNNDISNVHNAGLRGLRSMEMLDLSMNQLTVLERNAFERLEWLVELRLDDNRICFIQGDTFNGMPRLRALSMRNNRLASFPEHAIQRLRGNIALLDIDGNPLLCNCHMLWMRGWLQETASMGPRCSDGTLLREAPRLSREVCATPDTDNTVHHYYEQPVPLAPGCADIAAHYNTSSLPSFNITRSKYGGSKTNHVAPSPEESEYFYEDYVDYPEGFLPPPTDNNHSQKQHSPGTTPNVISTTNRYTIGDTPVLYAASKPYGNGTSTSSSTKTKKPPKEVIGSPSSSGFTFFGVPLPSLSLNSLLGGNGRMESTTARRQNTPTTATSVSSTTLMSSSSTPIITAERKTAIVNGPPSASPRRPNFFNYRPEHHRTQQQVPPYLLINEPEIQQGGFMPVLPGSGGFQPYFPHEHDSPLVKKMINHTAAAATVERVKPNTSSKPHRVVTRMTTTSSTTTPIPPTITELYVTTTSTQKTPDNTQAVKEVLHERPIDPDTYVTTANGPEDEVADEYQATTIAVDETTARIEELRPIQNITDILSASSTNKINSFQSALGAVSSVAPPSDTNSTSSSPKFEDIFKEVIDNVSVPTATETISPLEQTFTTPSIKKTQLSKQEVPKIPLSTLLIPGGDQTSSFNKYAPGRSTVTKVHKSSVHYTDDADESAASVSQPGENIVAEAHNRVGKNTILGSRDNGNSVTSVDHFEVAEVNDWYFANYNRTNLESYIAPSIVSSTAVSSMSSNKIGAETSQSSYSTVHFVVNANVNIYRIGIL